MLIETKQYIKMINNKLPNLYSPIRLACFDLDGTIIKRPTRKSNEWELLDNSIIDEFSDLIYNNYLIIIFTNQGGMTLNKNFDIEKWKDNFKKILKKILSKIPYKEYYIAIYVAKDYDIYRKPNIGMWSLMKEDIKNIFNINKLKISKKSFFCGDAAGRITGGEFSKSKKKDFTDTDLKFALNINLTFYTPEELLLENPKKISRKLEGIDPKNVIDKITTKKYIFKPHKKEMILMIGPPGSGKSYFIKKYIIPNDYTCVSLDICKTKIKFYSRINDLICNKKSIVIDNTNYDIKSRFPCIELAKKNNYFIRAIVLNTDIQIAKHLNNVRHVYSKGQIPKIKNIVYNNFNKKYEKPSKKEGFDIIENIDFYFDPNKLNNHKWMKIFMLYSEA